MQAHTKIVLHIDDDDEDRELIKEIFESKKRPGIVLKQMISGTAALPYLEKAKLSEILLCLIILDLNMPGLDGKAVLHKIKMDEFLEKIPVVILTTSSSDLDKFFARKYKVEFITKPPIFQDLEDRIDKLLSHY